MSAAKVHFELFARRKVNAPWTLEIASEDRGRVVEAAEELMESKRAAAVKVTKEILDPETGAFKSITILTKGEVGTTKKSKMDDHEETPLCVTPADLYTKHARERIGRLMEGWLTRNRCTPFELLHRPDLVEQLEASGVEIQHAVQKIAVPESQARGLSVHQMVRTFQALIERAMERLIKDGRKQSFPEIGGSPFTAATTSVIDHPDRAYLLGGAVAAYIGKAATWREKVGLVLDLADTAPDSGPPRALALQVLEQPLSEMLGSQGGLADILGEGMDLGGNLAALTRLAAGREVAALCRMDAGIAKQIPALEGHAARLSAWLEKEAFQSVRVAIGRRILRELASPLRLRPDDTEGEIAIMRALAMALTAASGTLLTNEEVQEAFIQRCKMMVTSHFVGQFLAGRDGALAEAQALVRLAENMVGAANKRSAAAWISSAVSGMRFEKDLRNGPDSPATKLSVLADLQKAVFAAGLNDADQAGSAGKIGEIGGMIEADAKLVQALGRAEAPPIQKLTLLLRLASGETAPLGPAADRAKAEALKLLRVPEIRGEIAANPDALERVRGLMQATGLAA